MNRSPDPVTTAPAANRAEAVRDEVRLAPLYPFTPVNAPVKLDQNEGAYDFPAHLKVLALERMAARAWNRYPDLNADALRARVAAFEGWPEDGVVVTPGSNVLIHALADAAGIDRRVLTVKPAFSLYALEGRMLGARVTEVPLGADFALPVDALRAELAAGGPGLLYLAEPHAPTGALHALDDVLAVVNAAGGDWVVVLDEAYHQFANRDHKALVRERANTAILRTMSKAWGLGGVRVGYMLAGAELAANVQKLVLPFNLNALTECAAEVALEHPEYVRERVQETLAERERVLAALQAHPAWTAYPSSANYVLIRTPDAARAWRALLDRGVLVRRQDSYYGLEGCLRVTIGSPADNDAFLAAAREVA